MRLAPAPSIYPLTSRDWLPVQAALRPSQKAAAAEKKGGGAKAEKADPREEMRLAQLASEAGVRAAVQATVDKLTLGLEVSGYY
eukprot:1195864-Prorocentrum_minimum.AAC.3